MDDRGRLAQSVTRPSRPRSRPAAASRGWFSRASRRLTLPLAHLHLPRFAGISLFLSFVLAAGVYGAVKGGHIPEIAAAIKDTADSAANAAGMRIATVSLSGQRQVGREEIFAAAGVTDHSSLLFLDVGDARARLEAIPWVAEATVRKFYPDRLQITITERAAFALWQKGGRIGVIADDGTVLEPYISRNVAGLPLFVGDGAATRAKDFLTLLERYPDLREQLRASVLVAERRWNLRLKNGVDVRLPEFDVARALDQLVGLDRDKKILSRDIVSIDLRLPDRVTVRMSEAAAQAREEALKAKKPKPKGGNA
jgi:cell division protein FtsQ